MSRWRGLLVIVAGAAALVLLVDVLRWMLVGPVELALLGSLLPPENRIEAEACLGALLGVLALVATGGLRWRLGPPVVAAGLTLAVCLADLRPIPSGDTAPATLLPFALVRDGRLTFEGTGLDSPLLPLSADPLPYFLVRRGERIASKYSPAVGLLAAAAYLPATLGRFDARSPEVVHLGKLAAALLTALGSGCVFTAAARLVGRPFAAAATVLYVLGTPVLSVLGQSLWLHTGAALGLSVALLALTGRTEPVWKLGAVVGLGVGLAVACRPVVVVLAAGFAVALWQVRPRAVPWMAAAAAIPVLLLAGYQWHIFGSPLATGYGAEAYAGWSTPLWQGVPGLLVSPGRGLLVESPVLLLAVGAMLRAGRGASPRWLLPLGLALVLFVCLMGRWWAWWGGFSPGNRMLSDALPVLGVALACGLRDTWSQRRLRPPVLGLAAVSVATFALFTFHPLADPFRLRTMALDGGPWTPLSHPLVAVTDTLLRTPQAEPAR